MSIRARLAPEKLAAVLGITAIAAQLPYAQLRARALSRRGASGLFSWLILFAVVAGFAIAFGLLFGVFNTITTQLNSANITVDSTFTNAVNTSSNFASIGILIVLAIGVIGLAMFLIRIISSMGKGV